MNFELAVLGGMLLSSDALEDCLDVLDGSDFADSRRELIFETCRRLHEQAQPVDVLSVTQALGDDAERVGAPVALHELVQACSVPASAGFYALKVRNAAKLRRVGVVGVRLQQLAQTDTEEVDDVVQAARFELDELDDASSIPSELGVIVQEALDEYENDEGLPTAWRELDELIYRWAPGRLYIGGARPGVGKSVLGACAALDVARRGQAAIVMSAEMSRAEVAQRLIANAGSVSMSRLVHRKLNDDDWRKIADARRQIDRLPIIIDDRPNMRVSDVASVARSVSRRHKLGLIVVDYLQLIAPPPHLQKRSREEQVAYIARSLKNLSKQLHVPILALAQLNRGSTQRSDKRPTISDLRESGEIEQAADVVMLLHRAADNSEDPDDPPDELAAIVPKNRQGVTGAFALHWQGDYARAVSRRWS